MLSSEDRKEIVSNASLRHLSLTRDFDRTLKNLRQCVDIFWAVKPVIVERMAILLDFAMGSPATKSVLSNTKTLASFGDRYEIIVTITHSGPLVFSDSLQSLQTLPIRTGLAKVGVCFSQQEGAFHFA
jgi:hypothetical protein